MNTALAVEPKDEIAATLTVALPITRDFVSSLLCNMFEGGFGSWWCNCKSTGAQRLKSDPLSVDFYAPVGFEYEFCDSEDDVWFADKKEDFPEYRPLNLENFMKGLLMFVEKVGPKYASYGPVDDAGSHDAITSDLILQYAIFGEYIFV